MTLILHDYVVLLAKQKPVKFGFEYTKVEIDLGVLSKDELNKLYLEAQNISSFLMMEISRRESLPTVQSPSTLPIAGAEVQGESNGTR